MNWAVFLRHENESGWNAEVCRYRLEPAYRYTTAEGATRLVSEVVVVSVPSGSSSGSVGEVYVLCAEGEKGCEPLVLARLQDETSHVEVFLKMGYRMWWGYGVLENTLDSVE